MRELNSFSFIIVITIFFNLSAEAQFWLTGSLSSLKKEWHPGTVFYKNGSHKDFSLIALPKMGDKKLTVAKDTKHKNTITIDAQDITCIKVWHQNFVDKVFYIYHFVCKQCMLQNQWGIIFVYSRWGVFYRGFNEFHFSKKTGELFSTYNGVWISALQRYYDDEASLIQSMKKFADFFSENEKIAFDIRQHKYSLSRKEDMQYLFDEMERGMNLLDDSKFKVIEDKNSQRVMTEEQPAENASVKEETVQNGEKGDDL